MALTCSSEEPMVRESLEFEAAVIIVRFSQQALSLGSSHIRELEGRVCDQRAGNPRPLASPKCGATQVGE